jgi:hypothetical protein
MDEIQAVIILFFFVTMLITFGRRRNIMGEFLIGVLFGFGWEILTLNHWDYNMPLVLFSDVSILIVIGWGVVFVLTLYTSDLIKALLKSKKYFIPDLISGFWGILFEWFGHVYFQGWDYNDFIGVGPDIAGLPLNIVIAWLGLVLLFNNFLRNYDTIIEGWLKRFRRKK